MAELPTQPARTNSRADIYQIIYAGDTEYIISGGGVTFKGGGITKQNILEVKFVGNPERSLLLRTPAFQIFCGNYLTDLMRAGAVSLSA